MTLVDTTAPVGTFRHDRDRWVHANSGHTPTRDESRCLEAAAVLGGFHNLRLVGNRWRHDGVRWGGDWIELRFDGAEFATCDNDRLTALVVAAHRYACRISITASTLAELWYRDHQSDPPPAVDDSGRTPATTAVLVVKIHARSPLRSTGPFNHHPGLTQLAASCGAPVDDQRRWAGSLGPWTPEVAA